MKRTDWLQKLDTHRLLELRDQIRELLSQHHRQIEAQLQRLHDLSRSNGQRKFPVPPKYRSKIDLNVTWSGRGRLPLWMREEMNGTNFSKEDFRIERRSAGSPAAVPKH
jgi:DNA-binding protein H-NS